MTHTQLAITNISTES